MVAYIGPPRREYAVRPVNTGEPQHFTCACGDRGREGVHTETLCEYVAGRLVRGATETVATR